MGVFLQLQETRLDVFFFLLRNLKSKVIIHLSVQILPIKVEAIPSRKLSCEDICNSIQAIPFKINLRKEKWLVISIYLPPSQDSVFFLNSLTKIIDVFGGKFDNYLIMSGFNLELADTILANFLDSNNLTDLTKTKTFFKGRQSLTDLILTNWKYSFKNTSSYETGLSNHHHMIYAMLKSSFVNIEPKRLSYRDFKNFLFGIFKEDFSEV